MTLARAHNQDTVPLIWPSQLNQASAENDYHDNCRAQWEVQTVTHCPGLGGSKSWYQGRTWHRTLRHSLKPCFHKSSQIIKVLCAVWSGGDSATCLGKYLVAPLQPVSCDSHFVLNICLISLKRCHWVFVWRRAQPGSRPVRCPKMWGACRLGRYSWIAQGLP